MPAPASQAFLDFTPPRAFARCHQFSGITGGLGDGIAATNDGDQRAAASITGDQYGFSPSAAVLRFQIPAPSAAARGDRFSGTGNTLTLAQGSVITGNVLGTGSDIFQLGGAALRHSMSARRCPQAIPGLRHLDKIDGSVWALTGTSTFAVR
jgi:hypothetical protein